MANKDLKQIEGQPRAGCSKTLQEGQAEMRAEPRVSLLIRAAKLISDDQEVLCIVRNISASGIKVRTYAPLRQGQNFVLETETGEHYEVELVWAKQDQAGLQFRNAVDVEHFVSQSDKPFAKRPIRLSAMLDAEIRTQSGEIGGRLINISQSGAQIECAEHLAINQRVRLAIAGMPLIAARVRWRQEPNYGLTFENAFRLDELGQLLALQALARNGGQI